MVLRLISLLVNGVDLSRVAKYVIHVCLYALQGDEMEHVKTMAACQALNTPVVSPHDRVNKSNNGTTFEP